MDWFLYDRELCHERVKSMLLLRQLNFVDWEQFSSVGVGHLAMF